MAILEGTALAATRRQESEIVLAWHIGAFSAAAQTGKLKRLAHYLPKRPQRQQTAGEMLAILHEFKARGANMNIKRVN